MRNIIWEAFFTASLNMPSATSIFEEQQRQMKKRSGHRTSTLFKLYRKASNFFRQPEETRRGGYPEPADVTDEAVRA